MKRTGESRVRFVLAAMTAAFLFLLFVPAASARDTVPQRLLRTIQIGVPQGLTTSQIQEIAAGTNTEYTVAMLARSALLVLQKDDPKLVPFDELLDGVLNHLVPNGNAFQPPPGLSNFRGKETVFAMVYAMVMSGRQDEAVELMEKHMLTGSKYKQAVVLSALRNIGTPRAISLIQQYSEKGQDRNLAETTLADEDYPVLFEIHDRWNVVPPAERTQDKLRAMVQSGCSERAAMAAYWLGYFPPNIDPNKEDAELQGLEAILHTNTQACEMMEHIIALKSLALRSRETTAYWQRLAQNTTNVWERHQIVIDAWGRWGRAFAPNALEMLKTDSAQYVQWELMDGNFQTRQGRTYRNYWDIWMPASILLVLEGNEAENRGGMSEQEIGAMLAWLESGTRPKDPWVFNHYLYDLAGLTDGADARRLLRIFDAHTERNKNFWIIVNLRDPDALPILRYWATLSAPKDQKDMLQGRITDLERRASERRPGKACCGPTEDCLIQQLVSATAETAAPIQSEAEARAWLASGSLSAADFKIHYEDELKRSAVVKRKDGTEERWQYLYDCWRPTDTQQKGAQ